jgi:hypothetical protein
LRVELILNGSGQSSTFFRSGARILDSWVGVVVPLFL